ncbi:MAG TPA: hypothetical protein VNG69_12970 [Casimicrobiaceae bacterium]|nr:hypothetical protein [Casimicrobiaceae bacterium]
MEKLEMRARARATARASRAFTPGRDQELRGDPRELMTGAAAPPEVGENEAAQARAACKPMGELEYVVQSVDGEGRLRALYVIVPDLALKSHYARLGFTIAAGCRVLLDAALMRPIAVLRVAAQAGGSMPEKTDHSTGFNPYFDMPAA